MLVDASAIVAIISGSPEAPSLSARLSRATKVYVTPIGLCDAARALAAWRDVPDGLVEDILTEFVGETAAQVIAISASIGWAAYRAELIYGPGRHRAELTSSDAFTYACAKAYRLPVLCSASGLAHTDLDVA
ncbi:MAG: PIN domain-containing protein [Rhizobiales bacterium]|nr:PIN domain-containing protein [Hyphomicrobiales bacterium]